MPHVYYLFVIKGLMQNLGCKIDKPDVDWLLEENINADNRDEWWENRENLKINGLDFNEEKLSDYDSKPNVSDWKELAEDFVEEHRRDIPIKIEEKENPRGYKSVFKSGLPEVIHIPAVREISEETKVKKSNPFGQLIYSMLESISDTKQENIETKIEEVEELLNKSEAEKRIREIEEIEEELNARVNELMDCMIEIKMNMPTINKIFKECEIFADDGVRTPIETKGHGMQRATIISILRTYSRIGSNDSENTSLLFLIEEPEIYMHPHAQKTFMRVLENISQNGDQTIYSTHSSLFVDIERMNEICILKKPGKKSNATKISMKKLQEDLYNRKGVNTEDDMGLRQQHKNIFNPIVNEGFFADKVVIVEGASEKFSLSIYADLLGYNFNRDNISLIHSDGKGPMDRLLRIFREFRVPTYIIFDGDKNAKGEFESGFENELTSAQEKTFELLNLLDDPIDKLENLETKVTEDYAVFEKDYEEIFKNELNNFEQWRQEMSDNWGKGGKPLQHKYVAHKIRKKINKNEIEAEEIIPETLIDIIEKIRSTTFSGSILELGD